MMDWSGGGCDGGVTHSLRLTPDRCKERRKKVTVVRAPVELPLRVLDVREVSLTFEHVHEADC